MLPAGAFALKDTFEDDLGWTNAGKMDASL